VRRARGAEKFSSPARKTFFDSIGLQETSSDTIERFAWRAPDDHGGSRMKIDGRCHCGQITFEAEVEPNTMLICHCTDCQTLTGSAYRAVVSAPAAYFVLRTGMPNNQ
jgi:Glutathione-dependent formaldehyde-activating enzyme